MASTHLAGEADGIGSSTTAAEPLLQRSSSPSPQQQTSPPPLRQPQDRRLLDRDAAFYQSRGRWRVHHASQGAAQQVSALVQGGVKQFWGNWFYALAYQRTIVLMLILFSTYTFAVFFYAAIYLSVSQIGQQNSTDPVDPSSGSSSSNAQCFCDMDIHDHMEALYFSLSTMTTIGYGVSDYYFGGCWTPLLLVLSQTFTAITFNAIAVGLLFQRFSRGHKRGKTVLFSNTAVVKRVRGRLFLQFRIAELRSHQLLEASVRAYCVRQERYLVPERTGGLPNVNENSASGAAPSPVLQTTHFVTKPMKLQHEDVSSHILMSLPQVIVHSIDERSPLLPPSVWYDSGGQRHQYGDFASNNHDILAAPSHSNSNDRIRERTCLESFVRDRQTEIIVLVEGSDELTGAMIQTRHSYTYNDLAWNQSFLPCVFPCENGSAEESSSGRFRLSDVPRRWSLFATGDVADDYDEQSTRTSACVIDFSKFHETITAPDDATEGCPYVVD